MVASVLDADLVSGDDPRFRLIVRVAVELEFRLGGDAAAAVAYPTTTNFSCSLRGTFAPS